MISKIEQNCNDVLKALYTLTKTQFDMVEDSELMKESGIDSAQLNLCIGKLHSDGFTGGGKQYTSLTVHGRIFWEKGGYKDDLVASSSSINISGDGNIINQDSFLNNARQSPTIHTTRKTMAQAPPTKSLIEIVSWIAGIIAAIIAVYEFLIKK